MTFTYIIIMCNVPNSRTQLFYLEGSLHFILAALAKTDWSKTHTILLNIPLNVFHLQCFLHYFHDDRILCWWAIQAWEVMHTGGLHDNISGMNLDIEAWPTWDIY